MPLLLNWLIGCGVNKLVLGLNFHMNAMKGALHAAVLLKCAHNLIEKQVNFYW